MPLLSGESMYPCCAYYGCQRNEYIALHERHLQETPVITREIRGNVAEAFQLMLRRFPTRDLKPLTDEQAIAEAPPSRRKRVSVALTKLREFGEPPGFARVSGFIKLENSMDKPKDDPFMKTPRLIQHRTDEYCAKLMTFMKQIEKHLFYYEGGDKPVNKRDRVFMKGMTSWEIAANFRKAYESFASPIALLADINRFDAHLFQEMRDYFRMYCKRCYRNNAEFKRLVDMQRKNTGQTVNGIFYTVFATLMSGDYNTSLEGSFVNCLIMMFVMRRVRDYKPRICGDDSVVFLDAKDKDLVDERAFAALGFDVEYRYVSDFAEVEFCQCVPMLISGYWRMVRQWQRVISRMCYTVKNMSGKGWRKLLGAKAICELACNTGVPVLQEYSMMAFRSAGTFSRKLAREMFEHRKFEEFTGMRPVTREARLDFWHAFGVTPAKQIELEQLFRTTTLLCLPQ
jgi:hypothetical protein